MAELEQEPKDQVVVNVVEEETTIVTAAEAETVVITRPRHVSASMWGVPEIAAVAVSGLVMLLVVVIYFFWVIPSNQALAKNEL